MKKKTFLKKKHFDNLYFAYKRLKFIDLKFYKTAKKRLILPNYVFFKLLDKCVNYFFLKKYYNKYIQFNFNQIISYPIPFFTKHKFVYDAFFNKLSQLQKSNFFLLNTPHYNIYKNSTKFNKILLFNNKQHISMITKEIKIIQTEYYLNFGNTYNLQSMFNPISNINIDFKNYFILYSISMQNILEIYKIIALLFYKDLMN